MGGYAGNAGVFLVQTLFGLYITAVLLRFLLQWVRADFYNPISQFLVKVTNPPLIPLRRFIPGIAGLDMAAVVLMLLLQALEMFLVGLIKGVTLKLSALLVLAIGDIISLLITVYVVMILVQVIVSWINPGSYNPVVSLVAQLNEPLLRPARNMMPNMGGFDLSPLIVMIVLQLLSMLLVAPITDFGWLLQRGE